MNSRIEVFVSYTHEDIALLQALKKHILLLKKQGLIDGWYDQDINAVTEREWEARRHCELASIILLLVSPDYLASDHCYSRESICYSHYPSTSRVAWNGVWQASSFAHRW